MKSNYEKIQDDIYDLKLRVKIPLITLACCLFILAVLWIAANIVGFPASSPAQYNELVRNRIFIGIAHLIIGACLGVALVLASLKLQGLNSRWRYRLIILVITGCLFVTMGYALEQFLVGLTYVEFDTIDSGYEKIIPIMKAYDIERMIFRLIGGGQLMLSLSGLILFIDLNNRITETHELPKCMWVLALFISGFSFLSITNVLRGMHIEKLGLDFIHVYWIFPLFQNLSLYGMAAALFYIYYITIKGNLHREFSLAIPVVLLILIVADHIFSFYNAYQIHGMLKFITRPSGFKPFSENDIKYVFAWANHLTYDGFLTRIPLSYGLYFLPLWFYCRINDKFHYPEGE